MEIAFILSKDIQSKTKNMRKQQQNSCILLLNIRIYKLRPVPGKFNLICFFFLIVTLLYYKRETFIPLQLNQNEFLRELLFGIPF